MYYPDISATSKVITHIAEFFSENKYKVNVISSNRDYNSPTIIYEKNEIHNKVNINRYRVPPFSKNKIIGRLLLSIFVELKFSKEFKKYTPDICFAVSNPPNMALKAAKLSKKKGIPFIFILHDLYPDVLVKIKKIQIDSLVEKKIKDATKQTFLLSDKIIVLGRDAKKYLIEKYNVKPEKIEIITNWGPNNEPIKADDFREKYNLKNKFVILYSGNIGETADFKTLIKTAKLIENDNSIVFFIIGNGRKTNEIRNDIKGLSNIVFLDYLSEKEYMSALNSANVFFVSLRKELCGISIPSKTYYYLSAGKPILAVLPENSEIDLSIKEDNYGFVCNDYSENTLKELIYKLKDERTYAFLKQNAINTFIEKYRNDVVIDKYIKCVEELTK